ncbi:MAG: DedA family protein [Acidobacteria bacterium]|nr:MAG: DedA family protein [Acidobacteriota bacterium]
MTRFSHQLPPPGPGGSSREPSVELIQQFFSTVYNVPELIRLVGLVGLVCIVFAETGLMVGFFLPGDSLLVTAGLFAARGDLDIAWLIPCLLAAAVAGNATGYYIGRRAGRALYSRPNSFFFRRQHLIRTHEFYERHGGKTIVLAQFMPIVRTFAPVVAGAADMTYRRFATFNVVGAILWITSMTLTGYYLGLAIPGIEERIHIIVAVVIFLSLLPGIIAYLRSKLRDLRAPAGSGAGADRR